MEIAGSGLLTKMRTGQAKPAIGGSAVRFGSQHTAYDLVE
jgi:hypothetical protein